MKRDTSISICKGLAIILMVIGHVEAPGALSSFIYEFHMPLFFITAGYFFSVRYINDEATFVKRRLRGLYVPFVKWAVFFLIIHNWMFDLGILNETYGNASGGVTHPYSWHQTMQNFWTIIFSMGGYDEFLAGAFWFFRGLLVASILYLCCYKLFDKLYREGCRWRHKTPRSPVGDTHTALCIGVAVCLFLFLAASWKTYCGIRIVTLVQRGDRDIIGCFFFAVGFLLRFGLKRLPQAWWLAVVYGGGVALFAHLWPSAMLVKESFTKFITLVPPAILGFLMTYNVSCHIDRHENGLKRFLVYAGDNTLCVFVFHIAALKLVSLAKIWWYGLDPLQIGCHMVIHEHSQEDLFWIPYSIVGVGVPLGCNWLYHRLKTRWQTARSQRAEGGMP